MTLSSFDWFTFFSRAQNRKPCYLFTHKTYFIITGMNVSNHQHAFCQAESREISQHATRLYIAKTLPSMSGRRSLPVASPFSAFVRPRKDLPPPPAHRYLLGSNCSLVICLRQLCIPAGNYLVPLFIRHAWWVHFQWKQILTSTIHLPGVQGPGWTTPVSSYPAWTAFICHGPLLSVVYCHRWLRPLLCFIDSSNALPWRWTFSPSSVDR